MGAFYRDNLPTLRDKLVASIALTPKPVDLIELGGLLSDASINSAWAAEGVERARKRCEPPDDDMLEETERTLMIAVRAVVAFRGRP